MTHGPDVKTTLETTSVHFAATSRTFTFTVTDGPDRGASFAMPPTAATRVLIGTSPACDLRLTDPRVSRRHAAIERVGPRLELADCESTNGTLIDNVRVFSAELRGGETLRLGATTIQVNTSDEGAQAATPAMPAAKGFGRLVGASLELRRLYPLCERLAASTVSVVLEGETGTGKEVLAESLHEQGPRADGPYVVFDCTACPPNLVESELFGHERGAFTGAVATRQGVFEQADGGTLLIDEIGDLELPLQAKLLRAIERSEVRRVGGSQVIRCDVRVLAATRRNLDKEVEAGRFRDDLFHRIAVARIELPPLRHRKGDVTLLASVFWRELGGRLPVPAGLLARWEESPWPGNVRELRNTVARTIALGELASLSSGPLSPSSPPPRASGAPDASSGSAAGDVIAEVLARGLPYPMARERVLDELDSRYVERLLAEHGGNVTHAARASGISRRYFQKVRARRSD